MADSEAKTQREFSIGSLRASPSVLGPSHVQRLLFIRRVRALGFGLDAIGSLLWLATPGRRSCASVRKLALAHLDDVRARLAELRRLEAALAETIAHCSGDTAPSCAVLPRLEAH